MAQSQYDMAEYEQILHRVYSFSNNPNEWIDLMDIVRANFPHMVGRMEQLERILFDGRDPRVVMQAQEIARAAQPANAPEQAVAEPSPAEIPQANEEKPEIVEENAEAAQEAEATSAEEPEISNDDTTLKTSSDAPGASASKPPTDSRVGERTSSAPVTTPNKLFNLLPERQKRVEAVREFTERITQDSAKALNMAIEREFQRVRSWRRMESTFPWVKPRFLRDQELAATKEAAKLKKKAEQREFEQKMRQELKQESEQKTEQTTAQE